MITITTVRLLRNTISIYVLHTTTTTTMTAYSTADIWVEVGVETEAEVEEGVEVEVGTHDSMLHAGITAY
jgi:hypothetical protein